MRKMECGMEESRWFALVKVLWVRVRRAFIGAGQQHDGRFWISTAMFCIDAELIRRNILIAWKSWAVAFGAIY